MEDFTGECEHLQTGYDQLHTRGMELVTSTLVMKELPKSIKITFFRNVHTVVVNILGPITKHV